MKKILIVLDLDHTHFLSFMEGVIHWIGGKERRLHLYQELIYKAKLKGIEVIFAVVSTKHHYDDICENAANAFKELLSRQNPNMIRKFQGTEYILVNTKGTLTYESLNNFNPLPIPQELQSTMFSHFHVIEGPYKSDIILKIANSHQIEAENILLLDDTAEVTREVNEKHIKSVLFEYFDSRNLKNFMIIQNMN